MSLVSPDGFELVTVDGFAAGDDCEAECCNAGCSLWWYIRQCPPQMQCDGNPPPAPRAAWICDSIRCSDGRPLQQGVTIVLDETCWVVSGIQRVEPNTDDPRIEGLDSVECIGDNACNDPRCPQGPLFVRSRPCGGQQAVYVCSVFVCGVYPIPGPPGIGGCHIVDPADGFVRAADLPPGAVVRDGANLPRYDSCCDSRCGGGCFSFPLDGAIFGVPDPCRPVDPAALCCCTLGTGRVRLTALGTTQRVGGYGGFPDPIITWSTSIVSESIDSNGCATYRMRTVQTVAPGFGDPVVVPDWFYSPGCGECGTWAMDPVRLVETVPQGIPIVTGNGFGLWSPDCVGQGVFGVDRQTIRVGWNWQATCRAVTLDASYRWFDDPAFGGVGQEVITEFTYHAEIVPWGNTPGVGDCAGRCTSTAVGAGGGGGGDDVGGDGLGVARYLEGYL